MESERGARTRLKIQPKISLDRRDTDTSPRRRQRLSSEPRNSYRIFGLERLFKLEGTPEKLITRYVAAPRRTTRSGLCAVDPFGKHYTSDWMQQLHFATLKESRSEAISSTTCRAPLQVYAASITGVYPEPWITDARATCIRV